MRGHRDLLVWQKAMVLVIDIYRATCDFPRHELYGLISQLRRAAVSIPSNLAEGHARNSKNEFRQFVGQARGSLCDLETQVEIAKTLHYMEVDVANDMLERIAELGRMLTGLRSWCSGEKLIPNC